MNWFELVKQNSVFSPADEAQRKLQERTQVQSQQFSPQAVDYFSNPTDTDEQMETARFFEQQQADAKRQAANLKRTKGREAGRRVDYRQQLKEGAGQVASNLNPLQDRGTGSKVRDLGANVGAGLSQVTTKLPQNVGRAMDVATAPVFKPIQTARKVGSEINRATGGAAGRITKPVREGVSGAVSGAAKLGRNIARDNIVTGKTETNSKGVPTRRFSTPSGAKGTKMGIQHKEKRP